MNTEQTDNLSIDFNDFVMADFNINGIEGDNELLETLGFDQNLWSGLDDGLINFDSAPIVPSDTVSTGPRPMFLNSSDESFSPEGFQFPFELKMGEKSGKYVLSFDETVPNLDVDEFFKEIDISGLGKDLGLFPTSKLKCSSRRNLSFGSVKSKKKVGHVHFKKLSPPSRAAVGKRVVQRNEVKLTHHTRRLPEQLPPMETFRYPNDYGIDDFLINGLQPEGEYNYESNTSKVLTPYSPRVYRYKKADQGLKHERAKGIVSREGLCPYCVSQDTELLFHDINSSQYSSHLLTYHAIFTTGTYILDPENHCYGTEIKMNGRKRETECVTCPYSNCSAVLKVGKRKDQNMSQHRLSAYVRHVAQCHKDRKNGRQC